MNYTIDVREWSESTVCTVTLKKRHLSLGIDDRQAPFNISHTRWFKGGRPGKNDWMKQRSYDGEKAVCMIDQKRWTDFRDAADYCGSLMATEWFGRRWPCFHELKVVYQKGLKGAWGNPTLTSSIGVLSGRIRLGRWSIGAIAGEQKLGGEAVVLHEFAHALCPREHHHSPLWARTYLELVGFRMGAPAYQTLKTGFNLSKARYRPYRLISPEQRVQLAERMKAVRGRKGTPTCSTNTSQGSKTC